MGRAPRPLQIFAVKDSFSTTVAGVPVTLNKGDLVDEKDPILKKRRDLFEPFVPKVRKYEGQRVEQATAAPGEQRS